MPWRATPCRALLLIFAFIQIQSTLATEPISGRASVIDGDTIEIRGQRIRLHGIDTPESRQLCRKDGKPWRCGRDVAFALDNKIRGSTLRCHPTGQDRYRRIVATCFMGNEELNQWLVRHGWALDYARYSKGHYAEAERHARKMGVGLWQGEFTPPWEWRRDRGAVQ